ncbi:class I SAM-dependent methyltransferase [Desulfobacterota bacterium M19]
MLNLKELLAKYRIKAGQVKQDVAWPAGHFYSPIPALWEIRENEKRIFSEYSETIPGINLNVESQLSLLEKLGNYYKASPFQNEKKDTIRYYGNNSRFILSDAVVLYTIIRHYKPRKIIEIGSGFSSCVSLDTNEHFFNNSIKCTFIEPYPDLLFSLLKPKDKERVRILPQNLQSLRDLTIFTDLKADDILFLDSSHVTKANSDVNHFFFNILPILQTGVIIHIHDIFYPFEYLKEWLYEGRSWNETYLLKAFLQYNNAFEIIFFNSFLHLFYADKLAQHMPVCTESPGGSFWMRKK